MSGVEISGGGPDIELEIARSRELAREANTVAAAAGRDAYRAQVPIDKGSARKTIKGRSRVTGTGFAGRVGPTGSGTSRLRFPDQGTGVGGPLGRLIPKEQRGFLRQGGSLVRPSGRGQRAQHFVDRARQNALKAVLATLDEFARRL